MSVTLLLIDDSDLERRLQSALIVDGLKDLDVQVVTASKPLKSMQDYAAYDGIVLEYDLIVTKGIVLLRAIHEALPDIPVVIYTGMETWHTDLVNAEQYGASYVLSKNKPADALNKLRAFVRDIKRLKKVAGRRRSIVGIAPAGDDRRST